MYSVPDQSGRRFVVTGANSGTGLEAATRLAGAGASVLMAVRDIGKGEQARRDILSVHPDADLEVRRLDLADLASVRAFAESVDADGALDVLVNNAGVMVPPNRMTTVDGFELQLGTNFLGPFALTVRLLPVLLRGSAPRVVTMSSMVANYGRIHFDDLQSVRSYRPSRAYSQSKLADLLMGVRLATVAVERDWPLLSTIAHPGFTRTNLQTSGRNLARETPLPPIRRSTLPSQEPEQGAEPLLFAASDPDADQGAYYGPSQWGGLVGPAVRVDLPRSARGVDLPASVWAIGESLTGERLSPS
ncbi:SDR family oxidoreductase [Microbacterium deminutum]|uniref:SDR family oxidoreductase n=1 Tax=Microbacterium deminutum TaxID=344164 RepID=A0ABP5BHE1_9MICO